MEKEAGREHVVHGFAPVYDARSRVLVLGTLPSVKSREQGFYYGHPQNRFWKVFARVFDAPEPGSIEGKKALLLENGVALWDVVGECEIRRSADSSIRNAVPNDIRPILAAAEIRLILCNGAKAKALYDRLLMPLTGREAAVMPSTSPANAACSLDRLAEVWSLLRA
jgi:hypoxanthine-DNA glycosylase